MSFADAIRTCLRKYATFEGRATRSEFWWFYLFVSLISLVGYLPLVLFIAIAVAAGDNSVSAVTFWALTGIWGLVWLVALLALLVPIYAVGCRRLHDRGQSGWLQLLTLVPCGNIVLIVFWALEGIPGDNVYGPPPA